MKSKSSRGGPRSVRVRRWEQVLAAWQAGGQSVAAYCAREKLSRSTFDYWKRRLTRLGKLGDSGVERLAKPGPVGFIPLTVKETVPAQGGIFEVALAGYSLRVPMDFEEGSLRRLVRVLREGPACG